MNASEYCYPEFKEGQVLTHNDLNRLRDFLYSRILFLGGGMVGFGIGCGLTPILEGEKVLRVPTGFALAQGGRELMLEQEFSDDITTLPTRKNLPTYPFLDAKAGGFTPVLRATDTTEAAGGECDEAGCRTHTDLVCQGAEVVFAPGKLKLAAPLTNAIFTKSPVNTPTKIDTLKKALLEALKPYLDGATLLLLEDIAPDGTAGTDLMKMGLVNEVLYTTWEYFRCLSYGDADCYGPSGDAAVALGWLEKTGTTWSLDTRYRHDFRLSAALFSALNVRAGYCDRYLDHIRVLLQTFEVPTVPPSNPPDPPEVEVCSISDYFLGRCAWWLKEAVEVPVRKPGTILIDPTHDVPDFIDPLWDPVPELLGPETQWTWATGFGTFDPTNAGLLPTSRLLGTNGVKAKNVVETAIGKTGITPQVQVKTQEDFGKVPGLQPALVISASDTIYLGVNPGGAVVAAGSVPTSKSLQGVPAIQGVVAEAGQKASDAKGIAESVQGKFNQLELNFGKLGEQFEKVLDYQTKAPPITVLQQAGGLVQTFTTYHADLQNVQNTLNTLTGKINLLEGKVTVQEKVVTTSVGLQGGPEVVEKTKATNQLVVNTLDAFADAVRAAAPEDRVEAVEEVLEEAETSFGILRDSLTVGAPLTMAQPQALTDVLDAAKTALESTGLKATSAEMKDLSQSLEGLKESMAGEGFGP